MQGKLVVFEGVEGCGKTTQLEHAYRWLLQQQTAFTPIDQFPRVLKTREPGGTALGQALRQLLLGQTGTERMQARAELLLYAADRAQHVESVLRPQLVQGAIVLCDRFTDSTVAYQGYGRGLDQALIQQLNQIATDGLVSDLTLWLDLDSATGLARIQRRGTIDRMEQADLAFHARVQQGFTELAQKFPERIARIDASQSEAEVANQIQAILRQRLSEWYAADSGE
jgi:dTMP kinase